MKDYAVTQEMISALIEQFPFNEDFDSHAVIQQIMHRHPQQYTTDLYSFIKSDDPIRSLHASIGQRLLSMPEIEKSDAGKAPTANVRGNDTANQQWRRKIS
ncbi:MAG TPA: hypothetical protein PLF40_24900 [Kofleriaceae bacterium]|nr:hypothetical protein [Kofleriaceae bacterium]